MVINRLSPLLIIIIGLFLVGYSHKNPSTEQPIITVFVHGTRTISKFGFLEKMFHTQPGMTHFADIKPEYNIRKLASLLEQKAPEQFNTQNFYTFGWSGKLSFTARKDTSRDLYNELCTLTKEYQEKGAVTPKFRLITHSHGGNVALNLANVKDTNPPFIITELILFACPVQEETKNLIVDPLFERVYSLFSRGDLPQVIDPQGIYKEAKKHNHNPLFSQRVFPAHPKLSQAKIKMHGRSILHAEFMLSHIISRLPVILDSLDELHRKYESYKSEPILLVNIKKHSLHKKEAAQELFT